MASTDEKLTTEFRPFQRSKTSVSSSEGFYEISESEGYDPNQINRRLNQMVSQCDTVASAQGLNEVDIPVDICVDLCELLAFPVPTFYLDGDRKWCFDWDDGPDDKGVYCRIESPNKLLVIVDAGGPHLRLPCDLKAKDPLKHLRYGLAQVFA